MTRRNEIIEEAKKHMYDWGVDVDRFDVPDIFAKGAEWMQNTMIEKACNMKLWIARDNNTKHEQLFGYYDEPHKEENYFVGNVCVIFNKELFSEVTFENSPIEVELVIKK